MAQYKKWIDASPDEPLADVARRCLESRFHPVLDYLPLAAERAEEDIEYVHQLRVWSRRALAATDLFRNLMPDWRVLWIERKLRQIRRASNDARDADVFALRLSRDKKKAGVDRLSEKVQAHRREAQRPILKVFRKLMQNEKFPRRIRKLLARVRLRTEEDRALNTFGCWAVQRFRPEVDVFLQATRQDLRQAGMLHRLRVKGKKVRYSLELFAAAFPTSFRSEFYPLLTEFQDRLGEINDHATAAARLQHWYEQDADKTERKYLGKLVQEELAIFEQRRDEFLAWWNKEREERFRHAVTILECKKKSQ